MFTLAPFRIVGGDIEDATSGGSHRLRKGGSSQWLCVAVFDGAARVVRHRGSAESAGARAVGLAKTTGDPVIVARQVGMTAHDLPVFEAVGRVATLKADPLTPEAFESWAESMAGNILRVSRADLAAMGTEALEHLAIDFRGVTPQQLDRALLGYRTTIAGPPGRMMDLQRVEIDRTLRRVVSSTGERVSRLPQLRQALGTGFQLQDRRVADLLSRHHSFFVRNEYGAVSQSLSAQARSIIAAGVERGAGRREIANDLERLTTGGLRMRGYYETVAANSVARARSYSMGASYRAAGIEFFRIEAVLDDRTTHQCEFLHQKILPVGPSMQAFERSLADPNPEGVMVHQPFIRDDGDRLTVPRLDGLLATVARIDQRSSGAAPGRNITSSFSRGMSASDLVSAAIGLPPYHHRCRTTTTPA